MSESPFESAPRAAGAKSPDPMAGGIFIGLGTIGGAVVGAIIGEPSAGLVGGLVLGFAGAGLTWLKDRRSN